MRREQDWPNEFGKISRLEGIEWLTAWALYACWPVFLSHWLTRIFKKRSALAIDSYVVGCFAVTIANWWMPTLTGAVVCSYFSLSSVMALLDVVFLSKALGGVESTERSLILFIWNVAQIVFMFSIWYQLEAHLCKGDALLKALLVLGTLGYPDQAKIVVGVQIATNFLLLAIFLAHLVGRVGHPRRPIRVARPRSGIKKRGLVYYRRGRK
jgi:hypothetical protein